MLIKKLYLIPFFGCSGYKIFFLSLSCNKNTAALRNALPWSSHMKFRLKLLIFAWYRAVDQEVSHPFALDNILFEKTLGDLTLPDAYIKRTNKLGEEELSFISS